VSSLSNYPSLRVQEKLFNSTCCTCSKLTRGSLIPITAAISIKSVASKR
jgi:hypothetical protein